MQHSYTHKQHVICMWILPKIQWRKTHLFLGFSESPFSPSALGLAIYTNSQLLELCLMTAFDNEATLCPHTPSHTCYTFIPMCMTLQLCCTKMNIGIHLLREAQTIQRVEFKF